MTVWKGEDFDKDETTSEEASSENEEGYNENWGMVPWYYGEDEEEDSLTMQMHIYPRGTMFHDSASRWFESKLPTTWCLDVARREGCLDERLDAMEAALSQSHIDVLNICSTFSCLGAPEVRGYIRKLMKLDRDWKVLYSLWEDGFDVDLCLDTLKLLTPVRYLQLAMKEFIPDKMLPILKTFPNLRVLDLSWVRMKPRDLVTWYQDEFWAPKLPYFWLAFDIGTPLKFPPAASQYLHTFKCYLEPRSKSVFPGWIQQLSRLKNLRHLHVDVRGQTFRMDYTESIQALGTWLSSPSCRLSHFGLGIYCSIMSEPLTLPNSLLLLQAIGNNRSIEQLCLAGLSLETDWETDVFPQLAKSSIHHLAMGESSIETNLFLDWIVEMRPIRYMTTDASGDFKHDFRFSLVMPSRVTYLSHLHLRWKTLLPSTYPVCEPYDDEPSSQDPAPKEHYTSLASIPQRLWATELAYTAFSPNPKYELLSLDAKYYLLQQFLSSISEIPSSSSSSRNTGPRRHQKRVGGRHEVERSGKNRKVE